MLGAHKLCNYDLVVEEICSYLSQYDIMNCSQVDRTWRSTFESIVWKSYKLSTPDDCEPGLFRNIHNIRSLRLDINNAAPLLQLPPDNRLCCLNNLTIIAHAHRFAHRFTNGFSPVDKAISSLNLIKENLYLRSLDIECFRELSDYFSSPVLIALSKLEHLTSLRFELGNIEDNGMMQLILEHCPLTLIDMYIECNSISRGHSPDPRPEHPAPSRIFTPASYTPTAQYSLQKLTIKYHTYPRPGETNLHLRGPSQQGLSIFSFLERCPNLQVIDLLDLPRFYFTTLISTLATFCPKLHSLDLHSCFFPAPYPELEAFICNKELLPSTSSTIADRMLAMSSKNRHSRFQLFAIHFPSTGRLLKSSTICALVGQSVNSLQVLRLGNYDSLSGDDITLILCNCIQLKELTYSASYRPLAWLTLESLASSFKLGWACHNTLEHLELTIMDNESVSDTDFIMKAPTTARLILELTRHLKSMSKLKTLRLNWPFPAHTPIYPDYRIYGPLESAMELLLSDDAECFDHNDIVWLGIYIYIL